MNILAIVIGFVSIVIPAATVSELIDDSRYSFIVDYQVLYFALFFLVGVVIYFLIDYFGFKRGFKKAIIGVQKVSISAFMTLALIGLTLYLIFRNFSL